MILKSVYLLIKQRLMSANIGIVHFDLWNNQFANLEEEIAFGYPAVFLEFGNIPTGSTGEKRQQADLTFTLHIGSEVIGETAHDVSDDEMDRALEHLGLIDDINELLQGYNGQLEETQIGSLQRTSVTPDHNHNSHIVVHTVEYQGRIADDSAKRKYVNVPVSLKINA